MTPTRQECESVISIALAAVVCPINLKVENVIEGSLAFAAVVCRRRSFGWLDLKVENVIEEAEFLHAIFLVLGLPEPIRIAVI